MPTWSDAVRRETGLVRVAIQALTRLPVSALFEADSLRRASRYFPLVGVGVGLLAAAAFTLAHMGLSSLIAAVLALGATVLLTGGLHEDGLADCCDGLFGGRTRTEALHIMRDSRIGVFGVLGLGVVLAVKVGVVASMDRPGLALVAGHAVGRFYAMLPPVVMPYARAGEAPGMAGGVAGPGWVELAVGGGVALAAVSLLGERAPGAAVLSATVALGFALWVRRRIGGYTGDVLGATQVLTETSILLAAAWRAG